MFKQFKVFIKTISNVFRYVLNIHIIGTYVQIETNYNFLLISELYTL